MKRMVSLIMFLLIMSLPFSVFAAQNNMPFQEIEKISVPGMTADLYEGTFDYSKIKAVEPIKDTYPTLDLDKRHRYESLAYIWRSLAKNDYVTIESYGKTKEKRNIYVLTIGRGEKDVMITAGVHGREACNPLFVTKFMQELVEYYNSGKQYNGVDVRDTTPNELDLKNRAKALEETASPLMGVWLFALYTGVPMEKDAWKFIMNGGAAHDS